MMAPLHAGLRHDGPHQPVSRSAGPAISPATLGERQDAFAAAIRDPGLPVPPGLVGPDGRPSTRRFSVYRNNVVSGLVSTLKAAYPAVLRIVGDEFFCAMARIFVARNRPASPVMLEYGEGFSDFIAGFEPAAGLPYLRDVATLERAWLEAYHAPEAEPVDPARLGAIAPDRLPFVGFALHPSLRLVRSAFPVLTLWRMNVEGGVPGVIDGGSGGEDVLVVRPAADVALRSLPAGAAAFVRALACGRSLGDAAGASLRDDPAFDLARALGGLLQAGAIAGWHSCNANPHPTPARPQ